MVSYVANLNAQWHEDAREAGYHFYYQILEEFGLKLSFVGIGIGESDLRSPEEITYFALFSTGVLDNPILPLTIDDLGLLSYAMGALPVNHPNRVAIERNITDQMKMIEPSLKANKKIAEARKAALYGEIADACTVEEPARAATLTP